MDQQIPTLQLLNSCYINQHPDNQKYVGIVRGKSSLIICYLFNYIDSGEKKYLNRMYDLLNESIDKCKNNCSFGYGISGFAWILNMVKKKGCLETEKNLLDPIDSLLLKECKLMILKENFDYFRGASGILFYFLNQDEFPKKANEILTLYIEKIEEKIENKEWFKHFYYPEKQLQEGINLGVPHGICGVLLLLLIKEKGIKEINTIIRLVTEKTLTHKTGDDKEFTFPSFVFKEENERYARSSLAWCNGDLMIAYAVLKSGILLKDEMYQNQAMSILSQTLERDDFHPQNLTLCHGHISLSHIYHKIFELTDDKRFQQKSEHWKIMSTEVFHKLYQEYSTEVLHKDFFENSSLFHGIPGYYLSLFAWKDSQRYGDWLNCLLL
jgi:hypothetical protein